MNTINNNLRWFLFAFISLFLIACKPTANFTYLPTQPSTGEVVKFDATKSSVYKASEGNAIAVYGWDFGDGTQLTGKTVEHSFQKAGKYTVQLSVTDLAGQTSITTQRITVKQASVVNKQISVSVATTSGATISDATVTIHGQKVNTDAYGQAQINLTLLQGQDKVVAQFEKSGYITQAIEYDVSNLHAISARLTEVKQIVPVQNIEHGQKIESLYLGASITISENSFAYADGRLANGLVHVEFTPWDIQGLDLQAMPANGFAIDAQGNRTQLISAGMISATFKDANGEKLQLVAGKTADIQMDLPLKSINNQSMEIGTEIPMWHFEESKGLWVEEGVGHVVASKESATGLAVHAKVKHFSTWNWDFKFDNAGSVFVQCQSAGISVPCHLSAQINLADNSKLSYTYSISAEGITVVNMPNEGTISWTAKDFSGTLIGETKSGMAGDVIIDLGEPTTNNFVSCQLANGQKVSCSGKMNDSFLFNATEEGSYLITGIKDEDGALTWSAESQLILEGNSWVRYRGNQSSTMNGTVVITLNQREEIFKVGDELRFKVKCNAATSDELHLSNRKCSITVQPYGQAAPDTQFSYSAIVGETVEISLPADVSGFVQDGTGVLNGLNISAYVDRVNNNAPIYTGYLYFTTRPDTAIVHNIELDGLYPDSPSSGDGNLVPTPILPQ